MLCTKCSTKIVLKDSDVEVKILGKNLLQIYFFMFCINLISKASFSPFLTYKIRNFLTKSHRSYFSILNISVNT